MKINSSCLLSRLMVFLNKLPIQKPNPQEQGLCHCVDLFLLKEYHTSLRQFRHRDQHEMSTVGINCS